MTVTFLITKLSTSRTKNSAITSNFETTQNTNINELLLYISISHQNECTEDRETIVGRSI